MKTDHIRPAVEHGPTMVEPYVSTHRNTGFVGGDARLHSHDHYEVLYWLTDCGTEYLVGPERYRLRAGDIIFIPPGLSHRPLPPERPTQISSCYVLWLSRTFMELYASLFSYPFTNRQSQANLLRTGGTRWEHLGEQFRRGVEESERKADGWEAAVMGHTMTLLTSIKRATNDRSARSLAAEKPELLDRIAAYIEENFDRSITIDELSRRFYVSSSTISHLFQQKLGVSFYRYVTQRRLIAAKSLMGQGLDLKTVALRTGFRDYSGFYRAFRQEFGLSPRQYRISRDSSK